MSILEDTINTATANRIADIERLESGMQIQGDFDGSVTGRWIRLNSNGVGIVAYKNKEYPTKPVGFTSIPAGTAVEMTHANGVYYSKW
jgi:hypothetical protein